MSKDGRQESNLSNLDTDRDITWMVAVILRVSVLGLLAVTPWYYGMVSWYSQLWCAGIALSLFTATYILAMVKGMRLGNPLTWSLVGLLLLALLQTLPVADNIWQRIAVGAEFERHVEQLASQYVDEMPASDDDTQRIEAVVAPRALSIYPLQSRASAVTLASAIAMLAMCGVLFRHRGWAIVLLITLSVVGMLHALVGLAQSVSWSDWTLLEMDTVYYFSTFISRNSAPQYYALSIGATLGILVWWRSRIKSDSEKSYQVRYPAVNSVARLRRHLDSLLTDLDPVSLVCILAVTFLIMAVFTTASRGGILACLCAFAITGIVAVHNKSSLGSSFVVLVFSGVGACMLLAFLGIDQSFRERLGTISEEAHQLDNARFYVWKTVLQNPHMWLVGSGLGTFHFAVLPYFDSGNGVWFYHAESIPIELLSELGLVGGLIALVGILWLTSRVVHASRAGRRASVSFIPVLYACSAIGLQSLVDFSLIIPAIFLPLCAVIGSFLGLIAEPQRKSSHRSRKSLRLKHLESLQKATAKRKQPQSSMNVLTLLGNTLLTIAVLASAASGWNSLNGFAAAESRGVAQNMSMHPEVLLTRAMLRQSRFQQSLAASNQWPSETPAKVREQFSEPERIAAAFANDDDSRLRELKQFALKHPTELRELALSCDEMSVALSHCTYDWRASWGILRSNLDLFSPQEQVKNLARLSLLTNFNPKLKTSAATAAILAGNRRLGLEMWKQTLNEQNVAQSAAALVALDVTTDELLNILPDSAFAKADVARELSKSDATVEFAKGLAEKLDLPTMLKEADSLYECQLLVWLAKQQQDSELEIGALRKVARATPSKDFLGLFNVAKRLAELNEYEDALESLESALRKTPIGHAIEPEIVDEITRVRNFVRASSAP